MFVFAKFHVTWLETQTVGVEIIRTQHYRFCAAHVEPDSFRLCHLRDTTQAFPLHEEFIAKPGNSCPSMSIIYWNV